MKREPINLPDHSSYIIKQELVDCDVRRWKLINNEREKNLNNNDTTDKLFEWFYWTNIGIIVLSFEKENSALKVQWNLIKRHFSKVNNCHKLGALKKMKTKEKNSAQFPRTRNLNHFQGQRNQILIHFQFKFEDGQIFRRKMCKNRSSKSDFQIKISEPLHTVNAIFIQAASSTDDYLTESRKIELKSPLFVYEKRENVHSWIILIKLYCLWSI